MENLKNFFNYLVQHTDMSLSDDQTRTKLIDNYLREFDYNYCIILHQGKPLNSILFICVDEARNYIKMNYSNRKFKEIEPNVFVCSRYGTTFKIIELINK